MANTGAIKIETGDYVSVREILDRYFSAAPPFAETGKKKSEFPDAIALLAIDAWSENESINVLAIAKDGDWESYCENTSRIDYEEDLAKALAYFNRANAPFALVAKIESKLNSGEGDGFKQLISNVLDSYFDGFTPNQDAESAFYWEPEGSRGWFIEFEFVDNIFKVVDKDEDWVVLEASVSITVGAEGDFTLSVFDSIDRDYFPLDGITVEAKEEFETPILITIRGNFDRPIEDLEILDVEVVDVISCINFGTLEPDFDPYD